MKHTGEEAPRRAHCQPLVIVVVAFAAGIGIDHAFSWPLVVWGIAGGGVLVGWLVLILRRSDRVAAVAMTLVIGAMGGAWHHYRWSYFASDDLATFAEAEPRPVCVEAIALKGMRRVAPPPFDPMRIIPTGEKTRLLVEATALRDGNAWLPVSGRVTLTVDGQLLAVHAGDRIQIIGTLAKSACAKNPGAFDQATHLRADGQLCRLWASHPACVSVVEPARSRGVRWWIESVRTSARETIWQNLSPGRAELASAVLLGARAEIDSERTNVFVETGTVHLLAISGLHVGIVAGVLLAGLRFFPLSRAAEFWIVVGWALAYTLLTDARPPAVRATILVAVLCLARLKCRPALPWNSLAAAGLIVLILNPADLFATGVHLSFLAVAVLMCVRPQWFVATESEDPLDRLIEQSRGPWERVLRWGLAKVTRLFVASAAVWLVTLPLVASRFHVVALGAVLLNMVVWIPMAIALVTGFLMILAAWLLPVAVPLFGRLCDASLGSLQAMIEAGHRLPGNPVFVAGLPDWWLLGFYGLLGLGVWATWRKDSRRWYGWGCLAVWLLLGTVAAHRFPPKDELVCTIVCVGHGSAAILEMPGGPVMLCDAGRMGSPIGGARDIASCLWSRKIGTLDAIAISHADADHFNAVPELMRRFSVKAMLAPAGVLDGKGGSIRSLRAAIDERQISVREFVAGDRLRVGDAVVEVLHPPEGSSSGHDNASSLVLSVEYAGRRIILPGDVEEEGLDRLLRMPRRPCDVLVAPHHGSLKTDAPGLAAWCSPRWVVVSGFHEPRIEPVAQAYRDAGAEVLYTGDVGAVTVTLSADGATVGRGGN